MHQGEEPKAPRDAAGYGSIRMITEARNSGFAARGREQMGSDTCSASRTTDTYFQPNAWYRRSRTGGVPFVPQPQRARLVAHPHNLIDQTLYFRPSLLSLS